MALLMNQVQLNQLRVLPDAMRLLNPPAPSSTHMRAVLGFTLSRNAPAANLPICVLAVQKIFSNQ